MVSVLGVSAQETKSQWDGVYTVEQAKRGEEVYAKQCTNCHGRNLEGYIDEHIPAPELAGSEFLESWADFTLGDLFDKIQMTMPQADPGTLEPAQSADVIAYILQRGDFLAGTTELGTDTDELKAITILREDRSGAAAESTATSASVAQDGQSLWDGVYTAEQARRGEDVYAERCVNCHGPTLEGYSPAPQLAGPEFVESWADSTLWDLFDKVQMTMPQDDPGTLEPRQ